MCIVSVELLKEWCQVIQKDCDDNYEMDEYQNFSPEYNPTDFENSKVVRGVEIYNPFYRICSRINAQFPCK